MLKILNLLERLYFILVKSDASIKQLNFKTGVTRFKGFVDYKMIYSTEDNIIPISIYNNDGSILPCTDQNLDNTITLNYSWYKYNRTMIYLLFAQRTTTYDYTTPLFSTYVYYL